ncbi:MULTISPECIES: YjcZ family sporulation protein [Paenibacillus]|uniref:Sporulation protein YjcZ n=1 Tax=Paenibacillus motobuensis TaxID=295324 RepID=A0ABP3HT56_9BACL|nr:MULTISPECIES: YjcZ family sporulation protein [unclassified Paenibacillus]
MSGVVGGFGSCGSCGSCGGGWTSTGTILVLFILLVIVSRTFLY